MFQADSQTVQLKFAAADPKWAGKVLAHENRLLEMIVTFGVDIVVNTVRTHPMVVASTAA